MAADQTKMWMNAISTVHPADEFLLAVGRDVVEMVRQSMSHGRERDDFEPLGHVIIEVSAS